MSSIRILIFSPYYKPASRSGGAALSIENFCTKFQSDYSISVITRNRDLKSRVPYQGVKADSWHTDGRVRIFYASSTVSIAIETIRVLSIDNGVDLIYLNSFFDLPFSFLPLIIRNLTKRTRVGTILAPRGELSPGALAQGELKKRVFLAVASVTNILRGITWQATSELERSEIFAVRQVYAKRIVVAPNLARARGVDSQQEPELRDDGPTKIIFLSRISPKKNLEFALRALTNARSNIVFDVYGPVEDSAYWDRCQSIAMDLPKTVAFAYRGAVAPHLVAETLKSYDLFFLPTLGENFGHAIVESWQAGVPVLISDRTPWKDLKNLGVGAEFPLTDLDKFTQYIDGMSMLSRRARLEQKRLAALKGLSIENDRQALSANNEMIHEAVSRARGA